MKTPRDLAVATLLGAEEWGVATAALVVEGCIMMVQVLTRIHVLLVSQHKQKLFVSVSTGRVEDVVTFFQYMAEGLREVAELGFRPSMMVGQSHKLKVRDDIGHWKYKNPDLNTSTAH
ncbi:glutamate synthase-related protein [Vibrio lentus]|nr:glutamate synthase-related protein [Vibrio lentus]